MGSKKASRSLHLQWSTFSMRGMMACLDSPLNRVISFARRSIANFYQPGSKKGPAGVGRMRVANSREHNYCIWSYARQ